MSSKILLLGFVSAVAVSTACSSATPTANLNQNTNVAIMVDANSMPPGLSASPLPPSTNTTPGIPPANQVGVMPKGGTPTPGIPDQKSIGKPIKPGVTPTPGIPSEAELRRQMGRPTANANTPSAANGGEMMMRNRKKPAPSATPQ